MEWAIDPTVWLGLATLVLLEIVLGIDNLVFIAILSDKVPPLQRNAARQLGLGLALLLRLLLLAGVFWLTTLTSSLFRAARPRLLRPRFDSPRWRTVPPSKGDR